VRPACRRFWSGRRPAGEKAGASSALHTLREIPSRQLLLKYLVQIAIINSHLSAFPAFQLFSFWPNAPPPVVFAAFLKGPFSCFDEELKSSPILDVFRAFS
jgi:hypothetical protein